MISRTPGAAVPRRWMFKNNGLRLFLDCGSPRLSSRRNVSGQQVHQALAHEHDRACPDPIGLRSDSLRASARVGISPCRKRRTSRRFRLWSAGTPEVEPNAGPGSTAQSKPIRWERWSAPMTMLRKVILCCWIFVVCILCREVPARGSLILGHERSTLVQEREELRNERLYEAMVVARDHDPTRFDERHPILGELLTDHASFEYWLNRWQAHPARFEHWHPLFWRIIDGEWLESEPPIIPPLIPPAGQKGDLPVGPGPPVPPSPPGPPRPVAPPGPPGPVAPPAVVPEPDPLLLLVVALGLILVVRGGFRFCRCQ